LCQGGSHWRRRGDHYPSGSLRRFRKDLTIHCPSRLERWRRRWRRGRLR
jgi:hypothetical protein